MNITKVSVSLLIEFIMAFIFSILLGVFSHAEIYSWTDEKGQRHFSNISPETHKVDEMIPESKIDEPFDPSMNAVPEEEVQASIEKRKAENLEREKKLEEERIAQQERKLEAERKAEEERKRREVEMLKKKLQKERDYNRRLRYKLQKKR